MIFPGLYQSHPAFFGCGLGISFPCAGVDQKKTFQIFWGYMGGGGCNGSVRSGWPPLRETDPAADSTDPTPPAYHGPPTPAACRPRSTRPTPRSHRPRRATWWSIASTIRPGGRW